MKNIYIIESVYLTLFTEFVNSIFNLEVKDSKNDTLFFRVDDCISNLVQTYVIKVMNEVYNYLHLKGRKCEIEHDDDLTITSFNFIS